MNDAQAQDFLKKLTKQIRGGGGPGEVGQKLSTEQLDTVLQLVRDGQLSPKNYEYFRQNSSQSSNRAYRLSPTDREAYDMLNPKTARAATDTADQYIARGAEIPDHLIGVLDRFHEDNKLSEEDYRRYVVQKDDGKNGKNKKDNTEMADANQQQQQPPAEPQNNQPQQTNPDDAAEQTAGSTAFVKVGLGSILRRLHVQGLQTVLKNTGGKIRIINTAYDEDRDVFNTTSGVYKIVATSTDANSAFGRMFKAKTARKALLMYLNIFLGPSLAELFKNASLYRPTTANGSQERRSFFGRLVNRRENQGVGTPNSNAGSYGSVKDVTDGAVSYWMKYQLVNGVGTVSECWIKFAEHGKPLLTESTETPSERNGWYRLAPGIPAGSREPVRGTVAERFVHNVEIGNEGAAVQDLRSMLEEKISSRLEAILRKK